MANEKCALCGKPIKGFGNNAEPLASGKCCDQCNEVVVAHRYMLAQYKNMRPEDKITLKHFFEEARPDAVVGARVVIYEMHGEPDYSGKAGVIQHIDDLGQLHGTWGGCALIPNTDTYVIIATEETQNG